jgi:maltose O-acetyltransferase
LAETEKQKMLSGQFYIASDPVLVAERERAEALRRRLNVTDFGNRDAYREILAELLPHGPSDLWIEPPFHCDYGYNITIGERGFFNYNCVILDVCAVTLGARALVGPNVQIYTALHPLDAASRRVHLEYGKPVTIGDDCWIGGGAIVCPGVTIGDRCVIGAGAVVTRDVPNDRFVAGNPARVLRRLNDAGDRSRPIA